MNLELRHILTSAVVLGLFGMLGTGIVAATQALTASKIERNEAESRLKLLRQVLPTTLCQNALLESSQTLPAGSVLGELPATLFFCQGKSGLEALALEVIAPGGYSGNLKLLIGINKVGEIHGVRVLQHRETPGLGDKIEARKSDWILSLNGHSLAKTLPSQWAVKREGGVFDQFTGATITPRAVIWAVRDTLIYFNEQRDNLIGQNDV